MERKEASNVGCYCVKQTDSDMFHLSLDLKKILFEWSFKLGMSAKETSIMDNTNKTKVQKQGVIIDADVLPK